MHIKIRAFLRFLMFFACLAWSVLAFAQPPTPQFTADQTEGCEGRSLIVQFTDQSTNNPTAWLWDFGDGTTPSNLQNPFHTYTDAGRYTVRLTATNANGSNSVSVDEFIIINPAPTIDFTQDATQGCLPFEVNFQFNLTANPSPISDFQWVFTNGAFANTANPTIEFTQGDNVGLVLTVTDALGCINAQRFDDVVSLFPAAPAPSFTADQVGACQAPLEVNFTNTTSDPNQNLTYIWQFPGGDPNSHNGPNPPNVTYNVTGSNDVSLRVITPDGCLRDTTISNFIGIGDVQADFDVGSTVVCASDSVTFTNTSSGGLNNVSWDFGDGTTSTEVNPVHVYADPGNYTVRMSASNPEGCGDDVERTVRVVAPPTADFAVDTPSVCEAPVPITFSNLSSNANNFLWEFGDGTTSIEASPTHVYTNTGTYTICLTATNGSGCSVRICRETEIITGRPQANFLAEDQDGCAPHDVTLLDISTVFQDSIVSWTWTVDGAGVNNQTFTDRNPQVQFTQTGIYGVDLIVVDAKGCRDTVSRQSVGRVGTPPGAFDFTVDNNSPCVNEPVMFESILDPSIDTTGYRFYWDFEYEPGSFERMGTEANPPHVYTDADTFSVALVIDNEGCAPDTIVKTDYMFVSPPVARFAADQELVCELPAQINIQDQSVGPIDLYTWKLDGRVVSTDPNPPPITIVDRGAHEISLVVENLSSGCIDSTFFPINAGLVTADFSTNDFGGCKPHTATFQNLSQNAISYQWDLGDPDSVLSTDENPTFIFPENGIYNVTLRATDEFGCVDAITQGEIRVLGPNVDFTADPLGGCPPTQINFMDNSSGIGLGSVNENQYLYNFGDPASGALNTTVGIQNPVHTYNQVGRYDVTLTVIDPQGCADSLTKVEYIRITRPTIDFVASDSATCAGNIIDFSNRTVSDNPTYLWDFGDGTTSSLENPSHAYKASGVYTVKLIVSDENGCQDSLIKVDYIQVESITADFVGNIIGLGPPSDAPLIVNCPNLTAQFFSQSLGNNIASYSWDFGDGIGISFLEEPTYTYTTSGNFDVSLTVEHEDGCINRFVIEDYVQIGGPTGEFTLERDGLCLGDSITLNITSRNACQIFVDPRDGSLIPIEKDPCILGQDVETQVTFAYNTPGDYVVGVFLFDQNNCQNTLLSDTLRLSNFPTANFAVDSIGCRPYTASFVDLSTSSDSVNLPIVGWEWDFAGLDTSSLQFPTFTFVDTGSFDVTLAVEDLNGCATSITRPVLVVPPISASFTASDTFNCAPIAIQFSDVSFGGNAISWQWNFGDGSAGDTVQNPTHTYTDNGLFDVELIVGDDLGCSDTLLRQEYVVLRGPTANLSLSRDFGCIPATIGFSGAETLTDTAIVNYSWCVTTLSNGFTLCRDTQGLDSLSQEFLVADDYEIELIVTDLIGCTDTSDTQTFSVVDLPKPEPIDLRTATVLDDNNIVISFQPYPGNDFVDYAIYRFDGNTPILLGNVADQFNTTFLDSLPGVEAQENSYCYKVLAQNVCLEYSDLDDTEEHCTVELATDPGLDQITLNWNPYIGWDVGSYRIYRAQSYELSSLQLIAEVPGDQLVFVDTATFCRETITYRVAALDSSGGNQISFSDISFSAPEHNAPTDGFNIGYVSVLADEAIEIGWNEYTGYKPSEYFLERSNNNRTWDSISTLPPTITQFVDTTVDTRDFSYWYRISVLDSCGDRTPLGLVGKSILLDISEAFNSNDPFLEWTQYIDWPSGVGSYELEVLNELSGQFELVDVISPGVASYRDRKTTLDQSAFCYRVKALEAGGNGSESLSNEVCLEFSPKVFAASAFSPNDDGNNDEFKVVVPFLANAELTIYDRWGELLFRTLDLDRGWDGTFNGVSVTEGVYVYVIRGTGIDRKPFQRSGTITLIR
ncbi:MAG: PKD domain-containing protein [Bacteroidota bacterium]